MTDRIGAGRGQFIWKLPDKKPDPAEGYISIYLPHPFMRLPSADEIVAPAITRKLPPMILSPRGGKRWPFDLGIIRPNMPTSIRERMIRKIVEDALSDRRKPKPRPAIKAPPKGDTTERKGSSGFMGIVRQKKSSPALRRSHGRTTPHAHMASGAPINPGATIAAHISAITFVRR
jgi:hypothetical protein